MGNLPRNWSWVKLGDVIGKHGVFVDGDWVESKDQDPDGEVRLIQLADIGEFEFRDKSDRFLTHQKALELNCTFLVKGDLLIARMPDPLGRACLFPLNSKDKFVTVVDVAILRVDAKKVDNRFLCYIINAPQSRNNISALQSGSTRKRISRKNLGTIEFPLPQLSEQKKIVEKIEELFSGLDSGVASLQKAKEQLRLYRQSVLAYAFSGRLCKNLINQIPTENNLPEGLPAEDLTKAGWKWVKLGEIVQQVSGCAFKSNEFTDNGVLAIKISNIGYSEFVLKNQEYLPIGFLSGYKNYVVNPNDLLIALTRPITNNTTKVCFYPTDMKPALLNQRVAVLKSEDRSIKKYIFYYFQSEEFKKFLKSKFNETLQPNLSPKDLVNAQIPIGDRVEQNQIVEEIEKRFSEADNLEKAIDESLEKSEALRQSILKQAFEGKLI